MEASFLIDQLLHDQYPALHALMTAGRDSSALPSIESLNRLADTVLHGRHGVRFEQQTQALGGLQYESRIFHDQLVPTRKDSLHDLYNAGCWLNWPLSKRLINQSHLRHLDADQDRSVQRSRARDYLTFLDEVGVVVLCSDPGLQQAHLDHDWQRLFVDYREAWGERIMPLVLGHGLLEQCRTPHVGLTAKCLYLMVSELEGHEPWDRLLASADRLLCARISEDLARFDQTTPPSAASLLLPLPVLGIPGWWPENTDPAFYDNSDYFRPRRKRSRSGH